MVYTVDFKEVATIGLESSPVAPALAGLRANEARYFWNKYKHRFTTVPASEAPETLVWIEKFYWNERYISLTSHLKFLLSL